MCTAVSFEFREHYFGRTLDYEFSYGEEIVITPRNFPLAFRNEKIDSSHYAIIGMAHVAEGCPLYYDAVNEKGLCMAALNFVGNAVYRSEKSGLINVAHFELIPFLLGRCSNVKEARALISKINITNTAFSEKYPVSELHWMISDKNESITVESTAQGIRVFENRVGVLTNNPPFDAQMLRLSDYMQLSNKAPENRFLGEIEPECYSRGMGAMGLPGDYSSGSRFVRAAFVKQTALNPQTDTEKVGQVFHVMSSVGQVKGCCVVENGGLEHTIYTACIDADKGIYYYTTYSNRSISAVDMRAVGCDGSTLIRYDLLKNEKICFQI